MWRSTGIVHEETCLKIKRSFVDFLIKLNLILPCQHFILKTFKHTAKLKEFTVNTCIPTT